MCRDRRLRGGKARGGRNGSASGTCPRCTVRTAVSGQRGPPTEDPAACLGKVVARGREGAWHWAEGRIEGSELVVFCEDVKRPVAVRYGYTNHPVGPLLYNRDGLPAGPFSTSGYGPGPVTAAGKVKK